MMCTVSMIGLKGQAVFMDAQLAIVRPLLQNETTLDAAAIFAPQVGDHPCGWGVHQKSSRS